MAENMSEVKAENQALKAENDVLKRLLLKVARGDDYPDNQDWCPKPKQEPTACVVVHDSALWRSEVCTRHAGIVADHYQRGSLIVMTPTAANEGLERSCCRLATDEEKQMMDALRPYPQFWENLSDALVLREPYETRLARWERDQFGSEIPF